MPTPDRAKTEYLVLTLVAFIVLGLGITLAIGKFIATPTASSSPEVVRPLSSPVASVTARPSSTPAWATYSDPADKFSLRYPSTWQQRVCTTDNHATLYLAPSTATLGVCNSDFGGQISVGARDGDQRAELKWSSGYADITATNITVAGASGIRQTATVSVGAEIGPEPGSKLVQYLVYKNNRTYTALYTQRPSAPDTLADFELMVKTTFTFLP